MNFPIPALNSPSDPKNTEKSMTHVENPENLRKKYLEGPPSLRFAEHHVGSLRDAEAREVAGAEARRRWCRGARHRL